MNNMLWFDNDLYVTKNMILVITGNILWILCNDLITIICFIKTNFFLIYFTIIKDYDFSGTPRCLYKHKNFSNAGYKKEIWKNPYSFLLAEHTRKRGHLTILYYFCMCFFILFDFFGNNKYFKHQILSCTLN